MLNFVLKLLSLLSVFNSYAISKKPNNHEIIFAVLNGNSISNAVKHMKNKVLKNLDENYVFENSDDKQNIIDERSTIFIHNSKFKSPKLNQLCDDTARYKYHNVLHTNFIKELLYAPDSDTGFIDPYETSNKANIGADVLGPSQIIQNIIEKSNDIEKEYYSGESKSPHEPPAKPAYTKKINNNLLLYKLENKSGSKLEVPVILNDDGILSSIPTYSRMMKYSQNMDSPFLTMPDAREYITKTRTYAGPIDAKLLYTSVLNPGQKEKQLQMKVPIPMLSYYTPQFFNRNGKVEVPTITAVPTRKDSVSQQNEFQVPKTGNYVVKPNDINHPKLANSVGPECRYFVCNIVKASETSKIMLECKCKQDNANSNDNGQKITYKLNVPKKEDRSASSPELHDYTTMLHDLERALNQEGINQK